VTLIFQLLYPYPISCKFWQLHISVQEAVPQSFTLRNSLYNCHLGIKINFTGLFLLFESKVGLKRSKLVHFECRPTSQHRTWSYNKPMHNLSAANYLALILTEIDCNTKTIQAILCESYSISFLYLCLYIWRKHHQSTSWLLIKMLLNNPFWGKESIVVPNY